MTTTDLTYWKPNTESTPAIADTACSHGYGTTDAGKTVGHNLLVAEPTGPSIPPTQPTTDPGKTVDTYGALTVLTGSLTALAFNASQGGDLVGYPIGATLAAAVVGSVVLYRSPNGGQR